MLRRIRPAALIAALVGPLLVSYACPAHAAGCANRPDTAEWFYLGNPDVAPRYASAARAVTKALTEGFDPAVLARDPSCIRVVVLDGRQLAARSTEFHDAGFTTGTVGFHNRRLGADDTVFVTPNRAIPLDVLMLHEVLHALSHRFSNEAARRKVLLLNEGATDYIARELAVVILGHDRAKLTSGYDDAVVFYRALMRKLGEEGPQLLADAYLRDGYDAFANAVDRRLDTSLGDAGRSLDRHDVHAALSRIGAR